jgi:hypothetical protein
MKKLLIAAAMLAAVSVNGFAYSWFVGGQAGLSSISPDGGDGNTVFSVSPYVGYLINDKSDVSVGVSYTSYGDVAAGENESEIGFSAAYEYAIASVDKLTFYISPSVSYTSISVKDGDTASNISVSVAPNIQYALSERIGLIAVLNFISLNFTTGDQVGGAGKGSEFSFGADGNATITSIGFYFNF